MASYTAEKAFWTVAQKVAELQSAIADLESCFETHAFGLNEWSEDLSNCIDDLEAEVMGDE